MKLNCLVIALFLLVIAFRVQAMDSVYTPLEQKYCKILKSGTVQDEGGDYFIQACPGREGVEVNVVGGDGRSWLVFLKNGREIYNSQSDLSAYIVANFIFISGKVLEWRYDNSNKLIGLIVRVGAQKVDDERKNISVLVVFRYDQDRFCYLGNSKSNEAARQLVDENGACP